MSYVCLLICITDVAASDQQPEAGFMWGTDNDRQLDTGQDNDGPLPSFLCYVPSTNSTGYVHISGLSNWATLR